MYCFMIRNQAITEINKIITNLPESKLEDLLMYLKQVERASKEKELNKSLLNKIFEEDKDLLNKLAK